jgi:type VII secretion-associated serine protease mycosin
VVGIVCASALGGGGVAVAQQGRCQDGSRLTLPVAYPGLPWAQQLLEPEAVWPLTDGSGVTVAVLDSGVDAGNPALAGRVVNGGDVTAASGGGPALYDCLDHGTPVAGIIGGQRRAGSGFAGMAPGARLLSIRVAVSRDGNDAGALADGIRAAVRQGAQVINVSLTVETPDRRLQQAVQYALGHDVVVVAAAGNENTASQGNPREYPASFPGVLAVGAIDRNGHRAAFSETATPVSVAAPGTDIVAPAAGGTGATDMLKGQQGTSFAAPFVAGTAALVRAYRPHLTQQQVVRRIEATAVHRSGTLPDREFGWGVVDPRAAVTAVLPGETGATPAPDGRPRLAPVSRPVAAPGRRERAALLTAAAAGMAALAVVAAVVLLPLGRRRGWRPGRWSPVLGASSGREAVGVRDAP